MDLNRTKIFSVLTFIVSIALVIVIYWNTKNILVFIVLIPLVIHWLVKKSRD